MGHEPRNRAERRAALRKARRVAGSALAASGAAFGTTAAVLNITASPVGAVTNFLVTDLGDAGDGTCDATCTLRDAIEDANALAGADTVSFDTDPAAPGAGLFATPQTITLATGQLPITDDLTITGTGAANLTIDGDDSSRVFYIYAAGANLDVTISGLTIFDGNDGDGGGVLVQGENLTLMTTIVTGNLARNRGGGIAALNAGGTNPTLDIQSSSINENLTLYDDGGGIYIENGTLTVSGGTIDDNDAADVTNQAGDGGGIASFYADIDISGTTSISQNHASLYNYSDGRGGGIFLYDGSLTISGATTLYDNSAESDGGGIFVFEGALTISGTTLIDSNYSGGEGGGIYVDEVLVTISGATTISNNDADGDGGGAVFDDTDDGSLISGATISGNVTDDEGGGIYFEDPDGVFTISATTISGNEANEGGGIYLYQTESRGNGKLVLTGSTISGNDSVGQDGGGIFVYGRNHGYYGPYGSYGPSGYANVDIINTTISGNDSDDDGGGLFFYHQAENDLLLIQGSTISGNDADEDGGGIYMYEMAGEIQIIDTTISTNTAVENGGGIYLYDTDEDFERTIRNTTISGNTAGDLGGGVHIQAIEEPIGFFNSTISGNTAGDGGALSHSGSSDGIDFVQTTITDNHTSGGTVGGILLEELGPLSTTGADEDPKPDRADKKAERAADSDADRSSPSSTGAQPDEVEGSLVAGDSQIALIGTIVSANDGLDIGGGSANYDDDVLSDHSLIGTIAAHGVITDLGGTIRSTNPGLAALANNGGPTQTHALLGASLAIDAGPTPLVAFTGSSFDQRGPGFARVINGRVDIGAYEAPLQFADFTG